jgi:hypothetical protein
MGNVKNINNKKETDFDYVNGLHLLNKSNKSSRLKFASVMVLLFIVTTTIFAVIPFLFRGL